MPTNRRKFIQQLTGLAAGFGSIASGLASCNDNSASGKDKKADSSLVAGTTPILFLKYRWRNGRCTGSCLQKKWTILISPK